VKLLTVRLSTTEEVGADRAISKGEKLDKTKDQARKLEKRLQELQEEHDAAVGTLERERRAMRKEKDQMTAQVEEMRAAWEKDTAAKEVCALTLSAPNFIDCLQ
jgi:septal ring factor EnvC (AmiA/AmiB activator)